MDVFVGAYASAPSLTGWDAAAERTYLDAVLALPGVRGLELPWPGRLHAHDPAWLRAWLPSSAELVVSDIGHTVGSLATDPGFGLASKDAAGRARAVADVARLRDDVARLAERARVVAVELHSAPLASAGDAAALHESLVEIATWDWSGADLVIEHCDTLVAGRRPEKGYLALDDEIAALAGTPVGLSMNWGRSAIELRDGDAVAAQIARAQASGLLRGLVFSGAADAENAYGPAWEDNHPPFAPVEGSSLLTVARGRDALRAAGEPDWLALKTGLRPLDAPIAVKVDAIARQLELVRGLAAD